MNAYINESFLHERASTAAPQGHVHAIQSVSMQKSQPDMMSEVISPRKGKLITRQVYISVVKHG